MTCSIYWEIDIGNVPWSDLTLVNGGGLVPVLHIHRKWYGPDDIHLYGNVKNGEEYLARRVQNYSEFTGDYKLFPILEGLVQQQRQLELEFYDNIEHRYSIHYNNSM